MKRKTTQKTEVVEKPKPYIVNQNVVDTFISEIESYNCDKPSNYRVGGEKLFYEKLSQLAKNDTSNFTIDRKLYDQTSVRSAFKDYLRKSDTVFIPLTKKNQLLQFVVKKDNNSIHSILSDIPNKYLVFKLLQHLHNDSIKDLSKTYCNSENSAIVFAETFFKAPPIVMGKQLDITKMQEEQRENENSIKILQYLIENIENIVYVGEKKKRDSKSIDLFRKEQKKSTDSSSSLTDTESYSNSDDYTEEESELSDLNEEWESTERSIEELKKTREFNQMSIKEPLQHLYKIKHGLGKLKDKINLKKIFSKRGGNDSKNKYKRDRPWEEERDFREYPQQGESSKKRILIDRINDLAKKIDDQIDYIEYKTETNDWKREKWEEEEENAQKEGGSRRKYKSRKYKHKYCKYCGRCKYCGQKW